MTTGLVLMKLDTAKPAVTDAAGCKAAGGVLCQRRRKREVLNRWVDDSERPRKGIAMKIF
jgi:hypothetical protein